MDESESLDAISALLSELAEKPYDISLHIKHIQQCAETMVAQVHLAREMFVGYFAAGEEVWIPLIEAKQNSEDLESRVGLERVLDLFERAEGDYLCGCGLASRVENQIKYSLTAFPILQKHVEFLVSRHAHFASHDINAGELGELFSTEWTRSAISSVVSKGIGHLQQA